MLKPYKCVHWKWTTAKRHHHENKVILIVYLYEIDVQFVFTNV